MTDQSPVAANMLAASRERMGSTDDAIDILRLGIDSNPNDSRLRNLWIRLEIDKGHLDEALELAEAGAGVDPTSWRMQRHIARIKRLLGDPIDAVKGHYEAAVRHNKGDVGLLVELGAYLFMNRRYPEANIAFSQASTLAVNSQERRKIRERWKERDGNRAVFAGKVKSIRGSGARAVAIPEGFEAFFWRARPELSTLREGDPINFSVGFNAYGAVAHIVS
jgi:hypothetical protein